jgi:hypothetical protein
MTNSFYYYSVYNITIHHFTVTIDETFRRGEGTTRSSASSELVKADMPTLLGPNQGMDFTLRFRVDRAPKKTMDISFDVSFDDEL